MALGRHESDLFLVWTLATVYRLGFVFTRFLFAGVELILPVGMFATVELASADDDCRSGGIESPYFRTETPMTKKDYHVVPQGEQWAVKREGAQRASSLHKTQAGAIEAGKDLASTQKTELVIHRPNGQIRDSDSFGRDPNPPKDKKH